MADVIHDWLPQGRTFADLIGRRVLVQTADPLHAHRLQEFKVVKVSWSGAYVFFADLGGHTFWGRRQDYVLAEVLPCELPNERAYAQMHGLLGSDAVPKLRAWFARHWASLAPEARAELTADFFKLKELDMAGHVALGDEATNTER